MTRKRSGLLPAPLLFMATALAAPQPAAGPWHAQQAWLRTSTVAAFSEAPARLQAAQLAALDALPARAVVLPTSWPRPAIPPGPGDAATVRSTWLTLSLKDAPPSPQGLWLYLPRWQTIGQIAIYADDRQVYRSHADLVWNGFNHPLLVPLDAEGRLPRPATLRLRIDSQTSAGGAVSTLWVGSAEALEWRYQWRDRLQVRLPAVTSAMTLGLAVFTLMIWLRRRHERTYLLFTLYAVVAALRNLHFHLGLETLPIPSEWFGWITVNCVPAMLLLWYFFVGTLAPMPARWPGRLLSLLLLVCAVATLPPLAVLPGMDVLAPLIYFTMLATAAPTAALLMWAALRRGGWLAIAAAWFSVADLAMAVHDTMMQNYVIGPESFYLGVLATLPRLLLLGAVILVRYVGAVEEAEQSQARLAQRLNEREAELAASHARLRIERQRQVRLAERQRLTQDMHEGMGARLMGALQVAESGQLSAARMARVLHECIEDLKLTVDSLEPVQADLLLLLATLRYRLTPRLQALSLQLHWDVRDLPPLEWLDPGHALQVLRILHQAISAILDRPGVRSLRVSTRMAPAPRDHGALPGAQGVEVALEQEGGQALSADAEHEAGDKFEKTRRRARGMGGLASPQPPAAGQWRFVLWLPLLRQPSGEPT